MTGCPGARVLRKIDAKVLDMFLNEGILSRYGALEFGKAAGVLISRFKINPFKSHLIIRVSSANGIVEKAITYSSSPLKASAAATATELTRSITRYSSNVHL